ncbi:hypothetical protein [Thermococcus camini]|uniref:Uncharacterized protein n=1 Tax=Thermococcus camini TaxID=2016373 RepID=A0A7G2D4D3_9EURY|nr:hypothetical protein [Thermococcus camini]CAD5243359.1 conserved membrane protein of unknown function [Thermococcus camini]
MKKGTGYLLNSLLISFLPWPVLWLISFFYFGGDNAEISKFSFTWLLSALASFIMVLAVLVFNLARLIERFGYSKGDVARLHLILGENFENVNLLKTVRESIHYHFTFWGIYATASLVYGSVKSTLFVISIVIGVILLSVVMLPVFVFLIEIPVLLYFTSNGELDKVRGLFTWAIEVSIASLALLGFLRFIALHGAIPPEYLGVSELRNLLQLAGDSTVFMDLFLLSFLGILSGITGYLGAKRSKLPVVVLFAIGILSIFTDVHLLGLLLY